MTRMVNPGQTRAVAGRGPRRASHGPVAVSTRLRATAGAWRPGPGGPATQGGARRRKAEPEAPGLT